MSIEIIDDAVRVLREKEREARQINDSIGENAYLLVGLLIPHIRRVSGLRAIELKAALRDLDGRTGKWKSRA